MGNLPVIIVDRSGNGGEEIYRPADGGVLKKQHNFFLPILHAYGINIRLLLAPLGAQGW